MNTTAVDKPQVYRLADLLDEWDATAEEVYEMARGNKPIGISSCFSNIDNEIGGYFVPGLHSIQGSPGAGKTAFALQIASTCGFPAIYVTCEMKPLELLRRITARVMETPLYKYRNGELVPAVAKEHARRAISACSEMVIVNATRCFIPPFAVFENEPNLFDIANTINDNGNSPVLIVIDSLHSWADKSFADVSEYEYLNRALISLQSLANTLNSPIITITERNRQSIDKGGLSGGAGTRKIEYMAESVIELDCEKDAIGHIRPITVKISKNRNGTINKKLELFFNGLYQKFSEEPFNDWSC